MTTQKQSALAARFAEIVETHDSDTDDAMKYILSNLADESAPFLNELRVLGWQATARHYRSKSRKPQHAPEPQYKPGRVGGSAVETEASKQSRAAFDKIKKSFVETYRLARYSKPLYTATLADVDRAIADHMRQITGNEKQVHFLEDVRKLLTKTPNGVFRKSDWADLERLGDEHGVA